MTDQDRLERRAKDLRREHTGHHRSDQRRDRLGTLVPERVTLVRRRSRDADRHEERERGEDVREAVGCLREREAGFVVPRRPQPSKR